MFKSWKTSLSGLGSLVGGIALIVNGDLGGGVVAIIAAFGLFNAKDYNVTGKP